MSRLAGTPPCWALHINSISDLAGARRAQRIVRHQVLGWHKLTTIRCAHRDTPHPRNETSVREFLCKAPPAELTFRRGSKQPQNRFQQALPKIGCVFMCFSLKIRFTRGGCGSGRRCCYVFFSKNTFHDGGVPASREMNRVKSYCANKLRKKISFHRCPQ